MNTNERERAILAILDVGIVIHAPNTSIIFSNPRASEILGLTEDKLKGKQATSPDWNFLREDKTPLPLEEYPVNQIAVNKKTISNMLLGINRRNTNDIRWVTANGIPIFDNNGEITEIIVSFIDITERKQTEKKLKESESRFRVMANSAPVLIWLSGTDKLCNWFNQVWLDYTGRSVEQETGNGWTEGIHPDDYKHCLETYLSAFDLRKSFSMEYRLRKADGQYGWLLDNGVPLYDGQIFKGYIGSCVDVSDRKKIENDLRLAKITADNASLIKSRFLDIAAHELRTPVTSFSLLIQLTQIQLEKGFPFEASVLTRLRVMADKISRLVVDLLDVSRLERGKVKLHLERIDLNSVITECVDDWMLREPDRMVKIIKPETPVEFNFDSLRITQVISNLLENVRKYTPKQSPVEITVEIKPRRVRISITDHGPGISDEQKTHLFNAFSRESDELTSRSGGLGLGLYISSEIIKLHGGTIGVISKMGEGSTFYFELPTGEVK